MDTALRAAGMVDVADPTADPSRDVEVGSIHMPSRTASRASLPLANQRSFSRASGRHRSDSTATGRPSTLGGRRPSNQQGREDDHQGTYDGNADEEDDASDGDEPEIPWGPAHPCFPHANPHVPLDSPIYQSTRIIRVKRDWMIAGDLAPAYSQLYPEILDPMLPEERFRNLVNHINDALLHIFSPWRPRAWLDAAMGLLTGWVWDDLGFPAVKKELAALERWIESWNAEFGEPENVRVIPLRRTAFLCLDIQVPDPQLWIEEQAAEEDADARSFSTRNASRSQIMKRASQASLAQTQNGSLNRSTNPNASAKDEPEYGAYPVPPIPGKFKDGQAAGGLKEGKIR